MKPELLAAGEPVARKPFGADGEGHNTTDDRTGRVGIAADAGRSPESFSEVVEIPGRDPEAKGDRVVGPDVMPAAELLRGVIFPNVERQLRGSLDAGSRCARWRVREHTCK